MTDIKHSAVEFAEFVSASGHTSGSDPTKVRGRLGGRAFVAILFAFIVLFLLIMLIIGMNVYSAINTARLEDDQTRLALSLVANSVRMNDNADALSVGAGPEGEALVLSETLETGTYETRIYSYQGNIVQEYALHDSAYDPSKARVIVASQTFSFTYADGLLTIDTDQGTAAVALRSVEGGA